MPMVRWRGISSRRSNLKNGRRRKLKDGFWESHERPRLQRTWPQGMKDDVLHRVATEKFRRAVEKAADHKIEASLSWHTLAFCTEEGKERIGYFSRALECRRAETAASPPKTPTEIWMDVSTQADCLFQIGRVHFYEGAFDAARRFLTKALPLAQAAEALEAAAGVPNDRLEGRIAELLLQL